MVAEVRPGKLTSDSIIFAMNYLSYYGNVLDIGIGQISISKTRSNGAFHSDFVGFLFS